MTRTATEIANFERIVENYIGDNLDLIAEYNDEPSAQDILDHWDTNGPEGIGEPLSESERVQFIGVAERVLRDELYEAAYVMLSIEFSYEDELRKSEEKDSKLLRGKTLPELLKLVGKTEQELRDELKENGTFF